MNLKHLSPTLAACAVMLVSAACGDDSAPPVADTTPDATDVAEDTTLRDVDAPDVPDDKPGLGIDYATTAPGETPTFAPDGEDWLSVGWPSDRWRTDGRVAFDNLPGSDIELLATMMRYGAEALDGFGLNSAIYFGLSGPIDPATLPSAEASMAPEAHLQLVNVTAGSPFRGSRMPLAASVQTETDDPLLPAHTLAFRPVYGFPLTEGEVWCAILTRAIKDAEGRYLQQAPAFTEALGTAAHLAPLAAWLPESPLRADDIAAATCFTTQNATGEMNRVARWIDDAVPPEVEFVYEPYVFNEFHGLYTAPNFQAGEKPYASEGGGFEFDEAGDPIVQEEEALRFLLLVPRDRAMPESGWPVVIYAHGTGGDYESCRGTADELLPRGFAVLCSDQPLHGPRGPGGAELDENGLILYSFNFLNPPAGRTAFRQAAADTLIQSRMIEAGRFDVPAASTRSGSEVRLDPTNIMFFGHSHGGLSGTLALGVDARVKAGVISGMSGVLVETILRRVDPIDIGALAAVFIGIPRERLDSFHPALNLIQTLVEATDPINYTRLWTAPPAGAIARSMFITQGTLDDASPSVGNDAAAAAGAVPLAAPVSKESEAHRLRGMTPLTPPFSGNVELPGGGRVTTVVRQWQGGSHFVATASVARNIWGHFLETAIGDDPPEVPAFGPLNYRASPSDGGDTCEAAPSITAPNGFPVEVRGNTAAASDAFPGAGCEGAASGVGGRDLVYAFSPEAPGTYRFRLSVPPAIDRDTPREAPNLLHITSACGDTSASACRGAAGRGQVDLTLGAGETVYLHVDGSGPADRGPFTLSIEQLCQTGTCEGRECGYDGCTLCGSCGDDDACTPEGQCEPRQTGDDCRDPIIVDAVPFSDSGTTRGFSNDLATRLNACPGMPFIFGQGSSDVIYRFTPEASGVYTVRVDAEHDVVVYASDDCEDAGEACWAGDRGVRDPSELRLELTSGVPIAIVVDGVGNTGNSAGDYSISIDACVPDCEGHPCGDDGCGGSCGPCEDGGVCVVTTPSCALPGQCRETRACESRPGEACADPLAIDALPFSDSRHTRDFLNDYGYSEGWCPGSDKITGLGASDVAYAFEAPEAGLYRFALDTGPSNNVFDASLYLVTDCDDIEATCLAADDRPRNEILWREFGAGEAAFVIVDGWTNFSNNTGSYKLDVSRCVPSVASGECGSDGCNGWFGDCPAFESCSRNQCVPRPGVGCNSTRSVGNLPWRETLSTLGFPGAHGGACEDGPATSASPDISYRFKAPEDGTYHITASAGFPVRLSGGATCGACADAGTELIVTLAKDETYFFVVDGVDDGEGLARGGDVAVSVKAYCAPQCEGKACGDDGCGGVCGTCNYPTDICTSAFECVAPESITGNVCAAARPVTTFPYAGDGDTSMTTNTYVHDEGQCPGWVAKGMGSNDEVWRVVADEAGSYRVTVIPEGWDAAVFAVADCALRASSCLAASDTQGVEWLTLELDAGEAAFVVIDGTENTLNDAGPYRLEVVRLEAADP